MIYDCEEKVLHKSKWATTLKCNNIVIKCFNDNDLPKIQKEVHLLHLSSNLDIELYYDNNNEQWCMKMAFIDLVPLYCNSHINKTIEALISVFSNWQDDKRYMQYVCDDWESITKPYMMYLLQKYLPFENKAKEYLNSMKSERFIHGDFILSNVQQDLLGNIIILDFEDAGTGPYLWDQTTLVYSFVEEGKYDIARHMFFEFGCSYEMLYCIASVRLARAYKNTTNIYKRTLAYEKIKADYAGRSGASNNS